MHLQTIVLLALGSLSPAKVRMESMFPDSDPIGAYLVAAEFGPTDQKALHCGKELEG